MDSILRIQKIEALLEAHPQGITGKELAESCNVPWSVMEEDLSTILLSTENPIPIYTDADESSDEIESLTPQMKFYLNTENRRNTPLYLTIGETIQILDCLDFIQMRKETKILLREKLTSSLDISDEGKYRYIKGSISPLTPMGEESLRVVEKALHNERKLSFSYKMKRVSGDPFGLVYYSRLRLWYLVVRIDNIIKTYNLSNIRNIRIEKETFKYPQDFSLQEWLTPRWGMEFGEPFQVKVKFLNRAQTIAKVQKDVAHRQCKLTEEKGSGYIIYEDTVIGKNEFIAWILGFGSAAEVLEPPEIRNEILERINQAIMRYQ